MRPNPRPTRDRLFDRLFEDCESGGDFLPWGAPKRPTNVHVRVTFAGPGRLICLATNRLTGVSAGTYDFRRVESPYHDPNNPWLVTYLPGDLYGMPEAYLRSFGDPRWGTRRVFVSSATNERGQPIAEGELDHRWTQVRFPYGIRGITTHCRWELPMIGETQPWMIHTLTAATYKVERTADIEGGIPWINVLVDGVHVGLPERALAAFQHESFGPLGVTVK